MEYLMALWLDSQNTPVYVVGRDQIGDRVHAISMSHADCTRGIHEALTLHSDHVKKAECQRAVPLPRARPNN